MDPWVIVAIALAVLLGTVFFLWRFVRRGTSALHRAAAKGNISRLEQLLLANPESVDQLDLAGLTPLQYAATWGQVEAARLLLARGAGLTSANGWTPLHYAAAEGHEAVARLLIDHGADVNAPAASDDSTPLHGAIIKRRTDVARVLLENGASPEARTKSNWTPCHFAASNGDEASMAVLLDYEADWTAVNSGAQNPLEVALANGHRKIVEMVQKRQSPPTS